MTDPETPAERASRDWTNLQEAVTGLSAIAISGPPEMVLARIAVLAVQAIPGADGVGLTMLEPDRPETVAVSTPFVHEVDSIQYTLREGPCITAATEGRTIRSGSLGLERAWPRFGPRVHDLGVHSVVSLPLKIDHDVLGALNVYAHRPDVFTARAAELGELFAVPAAVAVFNVRLLLQAKRLATEMQAALTSRAVIDRAIGITMSRQGGSADDAFERLRALSQRDNIKLAAVAQTLLDDAVRRARARHSAG